MGTQIKNETKQITITIGRNVGSRPMTPNQWNTFKSEVEGMFTQLYVNVSSIGEWGGVKEESQVYVGECECGVEYLELKLAMLASMYEQDAIGLLVNSRRTSLVSRAA